MVPISNVKDLMYCVVLLFALIWSCDLVQGFHVGQIGHRRTPTIICRQHRFDSDGGDGIVFDTPLSRRRTLQSLPFLGLISSWVFNKDAALAADEVPSSTSQTVVVSGKASLPSDVVLDESTTSNAALYVTVRPDTPDNVPAAILSGTRGKPPPVMAARFASPTFPFDFQLTAPQNLTPEGASGITDPAALQNVSSFWWANDNLIVSARWDSDGVAATRSPEDLVGRAVCRRGAAGTVEVKLEGRGAFGKFVTGSGSK